MQHWEKNGVTIITPFLIFAYALEFNAAKTSFKLIVFAGTGLEADAIGADTGAGATGVGATASTAASFCANAVNDARGLIVAGATTGSTTGAGAGVGAETSSALFFKKSATTVEGADVGKLTGAILTVVSAVLLFSFNTKKPSCK